MEEEVIERDIVNDRPATVVYYDAEIQQTDRDAWVFAKIYFDDGEVVIVKQNEPPDPLLQAQNGLAVEE